MHKTNAMRLLDKAKVPYEAVEYIHKKEDPVDAVSVAASLGEPIDQVFKTLVCAAGKDHFVFVIPGAAELDLKKAAKTAGVKSLEMMHVKDLLGTTGYVRGGCSPFGMKKAFSTWVDESVLEQPWVYVSGGKIGTQLKLKPADLLAAGKFATGDVVRKENS